MRIWASVCFVVVAAVAVGLHSGVRGADEVVAPRRPVGYVDTENPYPKHPFHFVGEGKCELSGRVVDANGNGVGGAAVYFGNEAIKSTGSGRTPPTWSTNFRGPAKVIADAEGRFSFNQMYEGRTDIWAETATAAGWTQDLDSDAKDVTIRLAPKGDTFTYDGTLFDTDGKTAVRNARVVLVQDANDKILAETKTDKDGQYHLQLKPPMQSFHYLRLVCIPEGRAFAWFTIPYCSGKDIDLQLKPQTTFTGRVVNETGATVAGAVVSLYMAHDRQYGYLEGWDAGALIMPSVTSDKDGWFTLKGVPQDASVGVQALHSDYRRYNKQDVEAKQIEQELVDIRLMEGAVVEGTVYLGSRDKPAEGVTVTLDYPVMPAKKTTTDKNGHYRFGGIDDRTSGSQQLVSAQSTETPAQWEARTYYEKRIMPGDHVTVDLTLHPSLALRQAKWKAKPGRPLASQFDTVILDNADPAYSGKVSYDDTLTRRDAAGKVVWQKKGINIPQNIGGGHPMAVDVQRKTVWVCEAVDKRLLKFSSDGTLLFEKKDINANSAALDPKTGNAWVLTSAGTIYGEKLLVFSPAGERLHEWDLKGYDIAYSPRDDCFWTVGKSFQKIDREGKVLFTSATEFPWVAMSVSVNETDGSVWIAQGRHPNVMESRGNISIVNSDGRVRKTFSVDFDNRCVVVDAARKAAWVGSGAGLYKVDLEGNLVAQIPVGTASIAIEPDTGYVWCNTRKDGLWRLDTAGNPVGTFEITDTAWVAFLPR